MSNSGGLGIIGGLLFGAIAAIGLSLLEAYQRIQEENRYQYGGSGNRNRSSDTPKTKELVKCDYCSLPIKGAKFNYCGNDYHQACHWKNMGDSDSDWDSDFY